MLTGKLKPITKVKTHAHKRNAVATCDILEGSTTFPNAKGSKRSQKQPAKPKRSNQYRKKPQPFPVLPLPPRLNFNDGQNMYIMYS